MTVKLTRRAALGATAALPLAAAPILAAQDGSQPAMSSTRAFKLGSLSVTTLLDGSAMRDGPKPMFGAAATDEEFARLSEENFISPDRLRFYFTPTLVENGSERILFDTGLGQGGILRALGEVGVNPETIDVVVITHMHGDHIGGLLTDDRPTFPNARYVTGAAEHNYWMGVEAGSRTGDLAKQVFGPIAEKTSFVEDGAAIASGMTALESFGHTPGHMCYVLDSDGQQLVLTADVANHYVWSFARPDWAFSFDVVAEEASKSRRRILGMLAADRLPMIGYHMPFPAAGFVEARGEGFRYIPVSYQLMG